MRIASLAAPIDVRLVKAPALETDDLLDKDDQLGAYVARKIQTLHAPPLAVDYLFAVQRGELGRQMGLKALFTREDDERLGEL